MKAISAAIGLASLNDIIIRDLSEQHQKPRAQFFIHSITSGMRCLGREGLVVIHLLSGHWAGFGQELQPIRDRARVVW